MFDSVGNGPDDACREPSALKAMPSEFCPRATAPARAPPGSRYARSESSPATNNREPSGLTAMAKGLAGAATLVPTVPATASTRVAAFAFRRDTHANEVPGSEGPGSEERDAHPLKI